MRLAAVLAVAMGLGGAAFAQDPTLRSRLAGRVDFEALAPEGGHDRFIVYYDEASAIDRDPQARDAELRRAGARLAAGLGLEYVRPLATGGHLVRVRDASGERSRALLDRASAEDLMVEMAANAALRYVEPDRRVTAQLTPNDVRYPEQWAYFHALAGTNTAGAWHYSTGAGIRVAVIDTGITPHSDLSANVIGGYDFISDADTARDGDGRDPDPNDEGDWFEIGDCPAPANNDHEDSSWHGSHVAGIIAAVTNNAKKGVAGVAFDAQVVPVRVLGKCGGTFADVAEAIIWASGGSVPGVPANPYPAQVINLSLAGVGSCGGTMKNAIDTAVGNGTVVVIAAGNAGANVSGFAPANCNNVIAVAAITQSGQLASYSNYGDKIDVAAPGSILSTVNTGTTVQDAESYAVYQGTSMAAPQVAGLAALILAETPRTPAQVEGLIKYNGTAALDCAFDPVKSCGWGLIDALHTMRATLGGYDGSVAVSPSPASYFEPTFFENANNYALAGNATVQSPNTVWGRYSGNAPSSLTVKMSFAVRAGGTLKLNKLKVELIAPDGQVVKVLHNQQLIMQTTQTVNASSKVADGLWKLKVTNFDSAANGYVNSWSLTFPGQFQFP